MPPIPPLKFSGSPVQCSFPEANMFLISLLSSYDSIYDVIKKTSDVADFPITKELRSSCRRARAKMALDASKKETETKKSEGELKRKAKQEEISELKRRKVELESALVTLKESLAKEAIASGTCGNKIREHATKAAAFAKEMVQKEGTLKELSEYQNKLEQEYKTMC